VTSKVLARMQEGSWGGATSMKVGEMREGWNHPTRRGLSRLAFTSLGMRGSTGLCFQKNLSRRGKQRASSLSLGKMNALLLKNVRTHFLSTRKKSEGGFFPGGACSDEAKAWKFLPRMGLFFPGDGTFLSYRGRGQTSGSLSRILFSLWGVLGRAL